MAEGKTPSPQLATSTTAFNGHFNFPTMSSGGSALSNSPEPSFTEVKRAVSATDQLPVTASDTNSAPSPTTREVTSYASVSGFSDNSSVKETPVAETTLVTTVILKTSSSPESGGGVAVKTLSTTDSVTAAVLTTSSATDSGINIALPTSSHPTSVKGAVTETAPTPELTVIPILATAEGLVRTFPTLELVTTAVAEAAPTPELNTTPVLSAFSTTEHAAAVTSSAVVPVRSNTHSPPWTVTSTLQGLSSAPDGWGTSSGVTAPAGGPPNTYVTGSTEGAAGVGPSLADAAASTAATRDSGTAAATDSNLLASWIIEPGVTSSEISAARTSGISLTGFPTPAVETFRDSATLSSETQEANVTGFSPYAVETSEVPVTSSWVQVVVTSEISATNARTLASSLLDNGATVTPSDLFRSTTMAPDGSSTPRDSGASHASVSDVAATTTDVSAAANTTNITATLSDTLDGSKQTQFTPLDVTDTTGAPPAQSSPHTSSASTPDPLSSTATGGQSTTDGDTSGDTSGDKELGYSGVVSDGPTTSLHDWPSVASSGPAAGQPGVTSLDNGTSNGTVASSHGLTGNDALVIILPVCLAFFVFVVIIIALALFCYRRKRRKQEEEHHSNEDLWVKPPTESLAPLSVSSAEPSVPDNVPEKPVPDKPVYTVIHEFPALQDAQLPLTVGSLVVVEEKADNGWWRGHIAKSPEHSGWFPSSFVEGIDGNSEIHESCPAAVDTEVESGSSRRPTISSFLIRKKSDENPSLSNSFSLGKLSAQQSKAASLQDRLNSGIPAASPAHVVSAGITADDLTNAVQGKHFKVLFAYKAAFRGELNLREGEIIIGKERDRNGWMLGTKLKTKEEGWFPAVYVDQIVGELPQEEPPNVHVERMELDQEVYGQLAVNRTKSPDQAWLGIEHVANYGYHGHSERELSFKKGDVLTVFEAQESGWWLGCHGDNVGWFPGAYVELLEQKSDNDGISLELLSPQMRTKDGSSKELQSQRSSTASNSSEMTKDSADLKSLVSASSESIIGEKPKPARKAPQPPGAEKNVGNETSVVVSGTGTLSRNLRPVRPAPAPPTSRSRPDSVSSMDRLSTTNARMNQDSAEINGTRMTLLKKTRKPKIVRIPKEKVGLDKISSCAVPKRPAPSVHEGEKPQKDDKEGNRKLDTDETTKQDPDVTADGEIEKECSLLAECMSQLVFKTSDVDGVSFETNVNDTKANNTDMLNCDSPTDDDPEATELTPATSDDAVSHLSGNLNSSSPFTTHQDQREKVGSDSYADPVETSQTSDPSKSCTKGEVIPQQGSLPEFSDSKPHPHSNHGTPDGASGHVHTLSDSDSWGNNISRRISSTPSSQEESLADSHLLQSHNLDEPQSGDSGDSHKKPSALLSDNGLVSEVPSSQRYSGHWKFQRDREQGQKPLRLTKVPPPVVPVPVNKKDNSEDEGEEADIPPPGVSGHVSMIVHQINKRLSMDSKNDRKPSRQLSGSGAHFYENDEEYDAPKTDSADETEGRNLLHHHTNHSSMIAQTNAENVVVNGLSVNDTVQSNLVGTVSSDSEKQTVHHETSNPAVSNTNDIPNTSEDSSDDIHRLASITKKRPPPPKSPPPSVFKKLSRLQTPRVWRTLNSYSAQRDDELSFGTAVFIRELSESEERSGWIYGMLTDGTSGFFSVNFAEIASSDVETEL